MVTFAAVMIVTYIGVAHERLHKTVAALAGAVVLTALAIGLGVFPKYSAIHEHLARDLNVFGMIIGTGVLVDVTGRSGLFHFLSMWIVRLTGGRAAYLYFALCGLTFLFTALLTIVPAMLILSSLVLVVCRSLDYDPKPFLLSVAICANSGALFTLASGLPNIMIGTAADIPYVQFLLVSAPYAAISLLIALALLRFFFRKALPWRQSQAERGELKARIDEFDPWALVENRFVLVRSALILAATVVGFALAQLLGVGLDYVAMVGGTAALLFAGRDVEDAISKVNWTVILFFTGLFVIVACVEATGALARLADFVVTIAGQSPQVLVPLLTAFAAVSSAIVDNIPVAATLIPIVRHLGEPSEPLWWSLILGCNLGGNATPIGSISCVIAIHTLHREAHVAVSWGEFLKIGGSIMIVQTIGAAIFLSLLLAWDLFPQL
jgi:Na+/H+ antiporter NhaD/arsenite permease-like protein